MTVRDRHELPSAVLLVVVIGFTACERTPVRPPAPNPAPPTGADVGPVDIDGNPIAVPDRPKDADPEKLYVAYCSPCHSLELVHAQKLDRTTWEWVMEDMVKKYGATWIAPEEQEIIIDYLTANYGQK